MVNREIKHEEGGVRWQGQTIGDDGGGVMFGKDADGSLWIRIISVVGGQAYANDVGLGDGKEISEYLFARFAGDAW